MSRQLAYLVFVHLSILLIAALSTVGELHI